MPYHRGTSALYDAVLLFVFAMGGIFLGTVSLRWMAGAVAEEWGGLWGQGFALGVIGLTGFGIYLGRYLRWNELGCCDESDVTRARYLSLFRPSISELAGMDFFHTFAIAFAFAYWLLQTAPAIEQPAPNNSQLQRRLNHHNRFDLVLSDNKKRRIL